MHDTKSRSLELRKIHNAELIRRMRNGEPLNSIDSKASWYPPRPTIKKDAQELARLYGSTADAHKPAKPVVMRRAKNEQVIQLTPPSAAKRATPSFDEAS